MSPRPSGYDDSWVIPCSRGDCQIGVGINKSGGDITAFLVQLQYATQLIPPQYTQIARFDHNPQNPSGHDIYSEGIHIDVVRKGGRNIRYKPSVSNLPNELDAVVDGCISYFDVHATYFKELYEGTQSPGNPPTWTP